MFSAHYRHLPGRLNIFTVSSAFYGRNELSEALLVKNKTFRSVMSE